MLARRSTFLTLSALAAVANARSLPDTMRLPCPMEQPDVVRAASCFFVTLRLSFLARQLGCATAVPRQLLSHSPSLRGAQVEVLLRTAADAGCT
jgi:hypothetical protein